jgi:hypothetical protein
MLSIFRGSGDLWHLTSFQSLKSILKTGSINPNINGQFPYSYSQSANSISHRLGAISLFDFDSQSVAEICENSIDWESFFYDRGDWPVVIRISRNSLEKDKLKLPFEDLSKYMGINGDGNEYLPIYIGHVEACYQLPISTSLFKEYLVIRKSSDFQYTKISPSSNTIFEIEQLHLEWAQKK